LRTCSEPDLLSTLYENDEDAFNINKEGHETNSNEKSKIATPIASPSSLRLAKSLEELNSTLSLDSDDTNSSDEEQNENILQVGFS
jgi:hypothetical protein